MRIIELPAVKMARSGGGDLEAFDRWWSALAARDKNSLFPKDFMMDLFVPIVYRNS